MILVDTSIWADYLRDRNPLLTKWLEDGEVLMHPYVVGELSLGNLPRYDFVLANLRALPQSAVASDDQVLDLIRQHRLPGSGIGYIDAHLLTATSLTPGARLWTRDKRLLRVAEQLDLAATFTD